MASKKVPKNNERLKLYSTSPEYYKCCLMKISQWYGDLFTRIEQIVFVFSLTNNKC